MFRLRGGVKRARFRALSRRLAISDSPASLLSFVSLDDPMIDLYKPCPIIRWDSLPLEEHEHAKAMSTCLTHMGSFVRDFSAALTLFDKLHRLDRRSIESNGDISEGLWPFIPARDGCMTIYHFGLAMEGATDCLSHCPTYRHSIDIPARRAAEKLFRAKFPKFRDARHAVAHAAELSASASSIASNKLSTPFELSGIYIAGSVRNMLMGRTYSNTINGEMVSYSISSETLKSLADVRDAYYASFRERHA